MSSKLLSSKEQRAKFKALLGEITQAYQRIDDERESIKEMIADGSATYGLEKKVVRKMSVTMYKHNYADVKAENQHFEELYETLVEGKLSVAVDNTKEDKKEEKAA